MHIEILGVGTPIIDLVVNVSYEYIASLAGSKGGAFEVDQETLLGLIQASGQSPVLVVGGSSANTIKGLACLGRQCSFFGKIGNDSFGRTIVNEMNRLKIHSHLVLGDLPTAQVACLISPDFERTMRSYMGAGAQISPQDITKSLFENVKLVHIEGYTLAYEGVTQRAMQLAQESGTLISLDLASFELVDKNKPLLIELISEYVDIVFANEDEIRKLTGLDPYQGCYWLSKICEISVVKMGTQGSWAISQGEMAFQPCFSVGTIDTTGAGDLFASAFLHGYLSGKSLQECSSYGAFVAAHVVQVIGTDIPNDTWERIKKHV